MTECNHEEWRVKKLLRQEPLERFDADSIGGHYEVVWCANCGAIKVGDQPWRAARIVASLDRKLEKARDFRDEIEATLERWRAADGCQKPGDPPAKKRQP